MTDLSRRKALLHLSGAATAAVIPSVSLAKTKIEIPTSKITHFAPQKRLVALTFDDGPHPRHTPRLLDILKEYDVQATFFVVGRNVDRYPNIMARMVDDGHEVANHTYHHPYITHKSRTRVQREIERTSLSIRNTTGKLPVVFRPPYGAIYTSHVQLLTRQYQLAVIMWSVDPHDWKRPGSHTVTRRIVSRSKVGSIILAHDIHGPTIRAIPASLAGLKDRGFGFTTVSEALGWSHWNKRRIRIGTRHWAYPHLNG